VTGERSAAERQSRKDDCLVASGDAEIVVARRSGSNVKRIGRMSNMVVTTLASEWSWTLKTRSKASRRRTKYTEQLIHGHHVLL
jgi:hypothetical protein